MYKPSGQIFSSPGAQSAPDITICGWARGRAKGRRTLFENPQLGFSKYIRAANPQRWNKPSSTQHPSVLTSGGPRSSADVRVRLEEPRPLGPTEVLRVSSAAGGSLGSSTSAFSKGFVDNKGKRVELINPTACFLGLVGAPCQIWGNAESERFLCTQGSKVSKKSPRGARPAAALDGRGCPQVAHHISSPPGSAFGCPGQLLGSQGHPGAISEDFRAQLLHGGSRNSPRDESRALTSSPHLLPVRLLGEHWGPCLYPAAGSSDFHRLQISKQRISRDQLPVACIFPSF